MRINCRHKTLSFYAVVSVVLFGFLLISLNVYQLWQLPWLFGGIGQSSEDLPIAWICSKSLYHLKNVITVFQLIGYRVVHSSEPPYNWAVMWSFDFPFNKNYLPHIEQMKSHQKVNHVPGTGYFTLKVELATSKLQWIPQAFSMPEERKKLVAEAQRYPDKLWVQKSNNHRGIQIVNLKGLDLNAKDTFVQQFVKNPILIDGKKFDIGVYAVITSVNPLRVYIYQNEFLVRFCIQNYKPFDVSTVEKYVVGADYIAPSGMPSLKPYIIHGHLSRKEALFTYLRSKGKNTLKLWDDIKQSIAELFISKEKHIDGLYGNYRSKYNFFELVRVDFIVDEDMNLWLMEVNMSPNLASTDHPENKLMYEQVLFHALRLVGIATSVKSQLTPEEHDILVNDGDILKNSSHCLKKECLLTCTHQCQLCSHCVSVENRQDFKHAFLEHTNRGNYRRVLPPDQKIGHERHFKEYSAQTNLKNKLMAAWFATMCEFDQAWCS